MNTVAQSMKTMNFLSIFILLDNILTNINYYKSYDQLTLILSSIMFVIQILILIVECCFQSLSRISLILAILKSIIQISWSIILEKNIIFYIGVQTFCLIITYQQYQNIIIICQCFIQILFLTFFSNTYLPISISRTVLCYVLIKYVLHIKQCDEYNLINQILINMKYNGCLLNKNFMPIILIEFYEKIKKEEIIFNHFQPKFNNNINSSKIITSRDQQDNQIHHILSQTDDYINQKLQIQELIQQLKSNNIEFHQTILANVINQQEQILTIEKMNFQDQIFFILEINTKDLIINKEQNCNEQVEIMIKTLQKVSHDMRNPLNAIINMQKCLQEQSHPELVQKYLKPSLNSCKLLLSLLNDILDSAQVKQQKLSLIIKKFNLYKLIQKTINIFEILIQKKELQVIFKFDYCLNQNIYSDKLRIRQIIMNLLSNAIKYSESRRQVIIECIQSTENINEIFISIQDNGLGIKKEDQNKLFGAFNRIKDEQNLKFNPLGVGLGLLISNELAQLLSNKTMQLQSEYGVGTKFTFSIINQVPELENFDESKSELQPNIIIPETEELKITDIFKSQYQDYQSGQISIFISAEDNSKSFIIKTLTHQTVFRSQTQKSLTISPDKSMFRKIKSYNRRLKHFAKQLMNETNNLPSILVVDDDPFNILALQYQLESINLFSDSAINGKDSILKVSERLNEQNRYIIVFMDIEMPILNGLDTSKKLLDLDNRLIIIPSSGHEITKEQQQLYQSVGMYLPIQKPISKQLLIEYFLSLQLTFDRQNN